MNIQELIDELTKIEDKKAEIITCIIYTREKIEDFGPRIEELNPRERNIWKATGLQPHSSFLILFELLFFVGTGDSRWKNQKDYPQLKIRYRMDRGNYIFGYK